MNIVIRNKQISDTFITDPTSTSSILTKKITAMFDVVDDVNNKYWVDVNGEGYFPLDITLPVGINDLTDIEIQNKCIEWLDNNSILGLYAQTRPELYQRKQDLVDNYQIALTALNTIQNTSIDTIPKAQQAIRQLATIVERLLRFVKERL